MFELSLTIVDRDRIIMPIKTVNECLNRWFVDMPDVRGRLPGFLALKYGGRVDQAERIYDHFAFDRLNRVNNNSNGTRVELFE